MGRLGTAFRVTLTLWVFGGDAIGDFSADADEGAFDAIVNEGGEKDGG